MYVEQEDVFYYITLYNENYAMPPKPDGVEEGILRGLYRYATAPDGPPHHARIVASGPGVLAALEAQTELAQRHGVAAEVWSATSWQLLRNEALDAERWNRLHPTQPPRVPWITEQLGGGNGPVIAVTDYLKAIPDQVARFVPGPFVPLGTDGYGRSDTRQALRRHFETDAGHVCVAVLSGLAQQGVLSGADVAEAIDLYAIDAELPEPRVR
jgi:pyruvate dehydrogenase E1 component